MEQVHKQHSLKRGEAAAGLTESLTNHFCPNISRVEVTFLKWVAHSVVDIIRNISWASRSSCYFTHD